LGSKEFVVMPKRDHPITDISGQKFNKLTVVRFIEYRITSSRRPYYEVVCDCGNKKEISGIDIKNGSIKSCGCLQDLDPELVSFNSLLKSYQYRATEKNITFSLTVNEFRHHTKQPCHYCGVPPYKQHKAPKYLKRYYIFNGLDRIDNKIGYEPTNVVACCVICNRAKRDLPELEFQAWIKRLVAYQSS